MALREDPEVPLAPRVFVVYCYQHESLGRIKPYAHVAGAYANEEAAYQAAVHLVCDHDHAYTSKVLQDLKPQSSWKETYNLIAEDWSAIYGKPTDPEYIPSGIPKVKMCIINNKEPEPVAPGLEEFKSLYAKCELAHMVDLHKHGSTPYKRW